MTGIICALKIEADGLKQSVENLKIKTVTGFGFIKSIKNIMEKGTKSVGIFIGSEGGFEKSEVDFALENGVRVATLGKRILRAETAPRNFPFNSSVKIPVSIIW